MPFLRKLVAVLFFAGAGSPGTAAEQVVRDQSTVIVGGAKETWRLVWDGKPEPVCKSDDIEMAITCPCAGLAYGEYGKLTLVRNRNGRDIEALDLRPLFGKFDYPNPDEMSGQAYLQRRPMEESDHDRQDDAKLPAEIERRPAPKILKFAAYDRSGASSAFLIQVGTLPCGKLQYTAVGVTAKNPHLHALGTVAHPDVPLVMPPNAWQALLKGSGPTTIPFWECGDHGSDTRSELVVSASNGVIRVKKRDYSCPGNTEKLVNETDE
jgi:hypothetical protein